MSQTQRIIFVVLVLVYVVFQISLGNRNEYVVIAIFSLGYYLTRRGRPLNLLIMTVLLGLFIFSFYITLFRDSSTRDLPKEEAITVALSSNEFFFPQQTTYYTIKDNWPMRYGETYLILPFQIMIPRSIYKKKPDTLGNEFIIKTFGKGWIGYAYTPVTEAYLNFGYIGPFFVFLFIAFYLDRAVRNVRKRGPSFLYLISYALTFSFCRGETSSIVYMAIFIYFSYYISNKLTLLR